MTLRELADQLAPLHPVRLYADALPKLKPGMVLYGGTVYNGTGPMENRQVATHGYRLVAHVSGNNAFGVDTLGLTKGGYAAVYTYCGANLMVRNDFLFRIDPVT